MTTVLERPDVRIEDRIEGSSASSIASTANPSGEVIRIATVERSGGRNDGAGWRELARQLFYAKWRLLPGWAQGLAFRMGAPKVSMGAVAVIRDGRGRILLAHHTYRQRAWGLPGGLVGRREQAAEAVARELREELGVAAMVGPLLYAETCVPSRHLTLYYLATIDSHPQLDGVELDGFRYVAPDEAAMLLGEEATAWLAILRHMAYPHTWVS
ncbi:MAG: NUDIX domain-containing protein [Ktedonobacterales bacterium]